MKSILRLFSQLLPWKNKLPPESEYLGYEAYSTCRVLQEPTSAATTPSKNDYHKAA